MTVKNVSWNKPLLALSHERQSAQMSEIENGRLGLHGTEHSKWSHLITLGFKGLNDLYLF